MQNACAPREWIYEAESALFSGQFDHALTRYEDILLSQSRPKLIAEKSAVCIEELSDRFAQELTQELIHQNFDHACLMAYQLEQMNPQRGEHLCFNESLSDPKLYTSSVDLIKRASDRSSDRLAQLLLCPLESQWTYAHRLKTELTSALLDQGIEAQSPQKWSRLYEGLNRLIDAEYSGLMKAHTPFLRVLRAQIHDRWSTFWEDRAFTQMESGAWTASWIDYSLAAADPTSTPSTRAKVALKTTPKPTAPADDPILSMIITQTQLLSEDLTRYGVALDERHVSPKALTFVRQEDETHHLKSKIKRVISRHLERWSLSEGETICQVDKRRSSREVRYLDHNRQVVSSRYKSALKRVELQQETLEAAQSQHENLEHSLKNAHAKLHVLKDQLPQFDQELTQIKKSIDQFREQRAGLNTHRQQHVPTNRAGPPSTRELTLIKEIQIKIQEIEPRENQIKIKEEIAVGAKSDHLVKLKAQREEIERLSGYLIRTVKEIDEANATLEARERELNTTTQFDHERVYSVFRYPVTEHHLKCKIAWHTQHIIHDSKSSEMSQRPPNSWQTEMSRSIVGLSHRAFARYGVKSADVALKSMKSKLLTRIRETLAARLSRWLDTRRTRWLTYLYHRWEILTSESTLTMSTQDELLTLLTYLDPHNFSPLLSHRLSAQFKLGLSFRLQPLTRWSDDQEMLFGFDH
jgi:hypothetical protein